VVFYNDHGLNFFLDNMPMFAIGAAVEYRHEDEGRGIPALGSYPGHPGLSWHIMESLVGEEFDPASCQKMLVDHAFAIPMRLLWPDSGLAPPPVVPIAINTVQHPLPSTRRCYKLGQAVGRAIESYSEDLKVAVIGTGGLSHQVEDTHASAVGRGFDQLCMRKLVDDPHALLHYSIEDLMETAGPEGVELILWIAARGAMTGAVRELHSHYQAPIGNRAAGLLVLEPVRGARAS
jgi:protocatechuate 4,5-dioxygenase beta chain